MQFRQEIEGLRGWAVLLVLLAHAGVPGLQGGFVGVDIFFVISGYLITLQLQQEFISRGRIDFAAFYARRVRRLMPALLFLVAGVSLLVIRVLPPINWEPQRDAATASLLWVANIHFSLLDVDYFGPQASENLFLHLWSLGVEEQFYLLWPLVLVLLFKFKTSAKFIGYLVLACFAASVVASWLAPAHAYYQVPFRLWQLASGGCLAIWTLSNNPPRISGKNLIATSGALLLAIACVVLSDNSLTYPGLIALLPTVSALLLIQAGNNHALIQLVSNPFSRALGAISYSLYLWHWPLLVASDFLAPGSTLMRISAVLLAILLAWISFRMVENPIRKLSIKRPRLWITSGLLLTFTSAFALQQIWEQELTGKSPVVVTEIRRLITTPSLYQIKGCDDWYNSDTVVECVIVEGKPGAPELILAGDSIAAQWAPALEAIASRHGWRFVVITKSSCPMLDVTFHYERIKRRFTECETWREAALARIGNIHPAMLVLGSSAANNIPANEWQSGFHDLLRKHPDLATRVRYLAPTPIMNIDPNACLERKARVEAGRLAVDGCEVHADDIHRKELVQALRDASYGTRNVEVIDTVDLLCPGKRCKSLSEGIPLWRDSQHINASAAASLAPELELALALEN